MKNQHIYYNNTVYVDR